jgi:signal transduction histidine kinase
VGLQLGAELEVIGEPRPVDAQVAAALAATAREGLTNVNKHAAGARVAVTLIFAPMTVRLEVVNGMPAEVDARTDLATTGGGAGLPGLRDRLRAVGGSLQSGSEGRRWVLAAECPAAPIGGGSR